MRAPRVPRLAQGRPDQVPCSEPMRIFLSMQHLGSFLMYEPVIRELAARGHDDSSRRQPRRVARLGKGARRACSPTIPRSRWSWLSPSPSTSAFWFELAKTIRLWADYLRYFDPHYAVAPKLKARAEERVPPRLVSRQPATRVFRDARNRRRLLARAAHARAGAAARSDEIQQQLREHQPDVVLITPLVYLGSWQFEVLRAALAKGLRTAFAVGSWDHLSSKALIRDVPQRVFVWNETQKARGGAAARRARRSRRRDRRAVLRPVVRPPAGADARGVLRVASACRPIGRSSCTCVRRSSGAVRSRRSSCAAGCRVSASSDDPDVRIGGDPDSAASGAHGRVEDDRPLAQFEHVALYGSNPMDAASKEDYFESLYYSSAVVGLNTSAFLEARDRRPAGAHDSDAGVRREPGRHAALPLPAAASAAACCRRAARFEEHHAQLARVAAAIADHAGRESRGSCASSSVRMGSDARDAGVLRRGRRAVDAPDAPRPSARRLDCCCCAGLCIRSSGCCSALYGTDLFRDDWRRTDPRAPAPAAGAREGARQARQQGGRRDQARARAPRAGRHSPRGGGAGRRRRADASASGEGDGAPRRQAPHARRGSRWRRTDDDRAALRARLAADARAAARAMESRRAADAGVHQTTAALGARRSNAASRICSALLEDQDRSVVRGARADGHPRRAGRGRSPLRTADGSDAVCHKRPVIVGPWTGEVGSS